MTCVISIPYGSIKRQTGDDQQAWKHIISIPYGSIKSPMGHAAVSSANVFQFLMVRLKVCKASAKIFSGIYFNSLWFD